MIKIWYHFFNGNIPHQMRYYDTSIGLNKFCLFTEEFGWNWPSGYERENNSITVVDKFSLFH